MSHFYKATCPLSKKDLISIYNPSYGYTVYDQKTWRSDQWNGLDYWIDFDAHKSIEDHLAVINRTVPKQPIINDNATNSENCAYCHDFAFGKNCYLSTISRKIENAYYSSSMTGGNWLVDCFFVHESQNCYECIDSYNLTSCFYLQNSSDSYNCWFGYDLVGCKNCLYCAGLHNQSYMIFNTQYTKEEYEQKLAEMKQSLLEWKLTDREKEYSAFLNNQIRRNQFQVNSTGSYGDVLFNAKNAVMCFNSRNPTTTKYICLGDMQTESQDMTIGGDLQLCYGSIDTDRSYRAVFSIRCRDCRDVMYCVTCYGCKDCFGCSGLHSKQYCIFNKQYTKEEYENTMVQIIGKMKEEGTRGEFFPDVLTPFAYNETMANIYYLSDKDHVIASWGKRLDREIEITVPEGTKLIHSAEIATLSDEDLLKVAITCESSAKPFRLIKQELEFYRKHGLPIPKKHYDVRLQERLERKVVKDFYIRNCDHCQQEMFSVYAPEYQGKVYCEECYNKEIYG